MGAVIGSIILLCLNNVGLLPARHIVRWLSQSLVMAIYVEGHLALVINIA